MKSKKNTYTYKTSSDGIGFVYAKITKYERVQLVKRLALVGKKAKASHLAFYQYLVENQNLKIIFKSSDTISEELLVISSRTIDRLKADFKKAGIIKQKKLGFSFCRIKTPTVNSSGTDDKKGSERAPKRRTKINQEEELIKRQEEQKKKAQAEYENYCSRKSEEHYNQLPEQEKKEIEKEAAEITNQLIQDRDTPIFRESVRKNTLNLIREHIQLPHFLEFFHDRSRVE